MAAFIPGGLFAVNGITSTSMRLRDQRLKVAKSHSDKIQRELSRDRMAVERKEKQLMAECRRLAQKGDMHGARLISNQIARYRRIQDRNLQSSVMIGTKTQSMISDHKVNKAGVETIKGFSYANMYENFDRAEAREQRYAFRMNAINQLENSMRSTVDDVYQDNDADDDWVPGESGDAESHMCEMEIQSILHQAMTGGKKRVYLNSESSNEDMNSSPLVSQPPFLVCIKLLDQPECGCQLSLNSVNPGSRAQNSIFATNTFTIDELKRKIIEDSYCAGQLHLYYPMGDNSGRFDSASTSQSVDAAAGRAAIRPFQVGRIRNSQRGPEFSAFEFNQTLSAANIKNGDVIYVRLIRENFIGGGNSDDLAIHERIQRLQRD